MPVYFGSIFFSPLSLFFSLSLSLFLSHYTSCSFLSAEAAASDQTYKRPPYTQYFSLVSAAYTT